MAPSPVAYAGSPSISPFAMAALARKQEVPSQGGPSTPLRLSTKMNTHGDFNGSCSSQEAGVISPETITGSCASYFADVTDYCCAAVGGYYDADFSVQNASLEMAAALNHPICLTSNYIDMLSCYQFVAEEHCSGTTPAPYGVCSQNGADTSKTMQQSTSGALAIRPAKSIQWTALALGVMLALSSAL